MADVHYMQTYYIANDTKYNLLVYNHEHKFQNKNIREEA